MPRPIVIAYHLMWTAYGWWLPNDPRGSTSKTIRSDVIGQLVQLHFGRKRIQPASSTIRSFYAQAGQALKHDLLTFKPDDYLILAQSFESIIERNVYTCYAAVFMPDHVHLLIRSTATLPKT